MLSFDLELSFCAFAVRYAAMVYHTVVAYLILALLVNTQVRLYSLLVIEEFVCALHCNWASTTSKKCHTPSGTQTIIPISKDPPHPTSLLRAQWSTGACSGLLSIR